MTLYCFGRADGNSIDFYSLLALQISVSENQPVCVSNGKIYMPADTEDIPRLENKYGLMGVRKNNPLASYP